MSSRLGLALAATLAAAVAPGGGPGAAAAEPSGTAAKAPVVDQLVVFRDGRSVRRKVSARETRVRVGGRRCAVGAGTPLAVLLRSRAARLRLRDFGSCSARPRDAAGLFVTTIGGEANRAQNGWVYKVGSRNGTAGAADPTGPFGRGRLRKGQRVTWFYCVMGGAGCQRTLALRLRHEPGSGRVEARVRAYDDQGRAVPAVGATVRGAGASALTAADGTATLPLPAGPHRLVAERDGLVRSFAERVTVR